MDTILNSSQLFTPLLLLAIITLRLTAVDLGETLAPALAWRSPEGGALILLVQATGRAHTKHASHDQETHTELVALEADSSTGLLPRGEARRPVALRERGWGRAGHWYALGVHTPRA